MKQLGSEILRRLGGRPIGFVDVGARGGVHPLIDPIAAAIAVMGFEPDVAECQRMRDDATLRRRYAKFEIEATALSDRAGTATLYEISASTNSSLRAPNPVFVQRYEMSKWGIVGRSTLETQALDEVLFARPTHESYWGEALKIDTQGTEFEILMGARRTLSERTLFLCVEVSFCELYEGQRLFSDVERLLREFGFAFYGFDRVYNRSRKRLDKACYWGRERQIQADAYFFRDPFDPVSPGRRLDERARLILATFAHLTGYHDFALELLEKADDGAALRAAIMAQAELPREKARDAVRQLAAAVEAHPKDSNVLVGKFVDERRVRNDFFDVPADPTEKQSSDTDDGPGPG
jgi:FkbM family methyltransferase